MQPWLEVIMKPFLIVAIALVCFIGPNAAADIYIWTDEDGVKHITNNSPPPEAKILLRTPEIQYVEEEDRMRREADRRERIELARQEIAAKDAELEEARREAAEAGRRAAAAVDRAEAMLDAAEQSYNYRDRGTYYYPIYYPRDCYDNDCIEHYKKKRYGKRPDKEDRHRRKVGNGDVSNLFYTRFINGHYYRVNSGVGGKQNYGRTRPKHSGGTGGISRRSGSHHTRFINGHYYRFNGSGRGKYRH